MHINLNQLSRPSASTLMVANLRSIINASNHNSPSQTTNISPSLTTSISTEAQELSDAALLTEAERPAELKSYIKSIDFTKVSAQEMRELSVKLYESGELSADQVALFMGIDHDTVQPKSATEKMNVIEHFNMMYDEVVSAAKSDATFKAGVGFRRDSINIFNALRDFAVSDKQHVLGGE